MDRPLGAIAANLELGKHPVVSFIPFEYFRTGL